MDQEEQRFNELYERTYEGLHRFVCSRCVSISDAADVLQNVYLELYRRIQKGTVIRSPDAYLFAVARHELARQYGWAAMRRRQLPVFTPDDPEDFAALESAFLSEEMPDDRLVAEEIMEKIRRLDPLTYQIFLLYFSRDCALSQIASQLKCKESLVKSRLYRGLKKLREEFSEEQNE